MLPRPLNFDRIAVHAAEFQVQKLYLIPYLVSGIPQTCCFRQQHWCHNLSEPLITKALFLACWGSSGFWINVEQGLWKSVNWTDRNGKCSTLKNKNVLWSSSKFDLTPLAYPWFDQCYCAMLSFLPQHDFLASFYLFLTKLVSRLQNPQLLSSSAF